MPYASVTSENCAKLLKFWIPTVRKDWIFEERYKCGVSGKTFEYYNDLKREMECEHFIKQKWFKSEICPHENSYR